MQFPRIPRLRTLLALLPLAAALPAQNIDRYISTAGNNSNDGLTPTTPWLTVAYAQTAIESLIPTQNADLVLHFAGGEYPLSGLLTYTSADSGHGAYTITYLSDDGPGKAAIVGALPQTFTGTGPVYSTTVSASFPQPPEVIYEGGLPAWPVRAPKRSTSNPRFPLARSTYAAAAAGTGASAPYDLIGIKSGDFPTAQFPAVSTWTLTNARLLWWRGTDATAEEDWGIDVPDTVKPQSPPSGTSFLITQDTPDIPAEHERYYVENVPELLTATSAAPGEFYYDPSTSILQYRPRSSTPNSANIRVPTLNTLIRLDGTSNMAFDGLKFAYTATAATMSGSSFVSHAALEITGASNDTITRCEFTAVGGGAIWIYDNSTSTAFNANHAVSHCWIHGCGVGGVWITDVAARSTTSPTVSSGHIVTDCLISEIGEVVPNAIYSAGVLILSAQNCTVSNCEIYNSVRYATSLRGNRTEDKKIPDNNTNFAVGNVFEDLRIHDCMMDSGDGGAVHAAGVNDATGTNINTWSQLVISGDYADGSMADPLLPNGMFLDYHSETLLQNLNNIDITYSQSDTSSNHGFRTNQNGNNNTGLGSPGETESNVSWQGTFALAQIDFAHIGLTSDFPRSAFALLANYPDSQRDGLAIADDRTIDFTASGSWQDTGATGLYEGDGLFDPAITGTGKYATDYAEWRPTLPYTGAYTVGVWMIPGIPAAATSASYSVWDRTSSTPTTKSVNQQSGGSGWSTLPATFTFNAGRGSASGYARLATSTTGQVRADAVEFTYLGSTNISMGPGTAGTAEMGWWKLDTDGTDSSANGLAAVADSDPGSDPVVFGAPAGSTPAVGTGAVELDGTNYLKVTTVTSPPADSPLDIGAGNFAVSLWFYLTDSTATNERLVAKGADTDQHAGYCLYAGASTVSAAIGNGTPRTILTAPHGGLNAWNHVVLNIDRSGSATLYVNGVNAASKSIASWSGMSLSNTGWNFYIGSNQQSLYWKGAIDDVRVYQRLLTDAEIQSLFRP